MAADKKKEKLELAKGYYLSNNFCDALKLLKELDQDDSKNSEIKLLLGITLLRSEIYDEAINILNEAIKIKPDIQLANHALGSALFMTEDYQGALSAFNREIELNPMYPDAYCDKGYALNEIGNYQEAFLAGSKAIQLEQDYADAYNCMSVALNHLHDLRQAYNFANKAIALDPSRANYFYNLASIQKDLGESENSIQLYHQAISLKSNYSEALFNLSIIYLSRQNFEQGWNFYESRFDVAGVKYKRARDLFDIKSFDQKNILLRVEQGIGDQILFGSLFNELQALKKFNIYIELDIRLLKTFRRSFKNLNFIEPNSYLNNDFLEFNLGSIGSEFRRNIKSFSSQSKSFLKADQDKVQLIKNKIIGSREGYKICGISWHSNNSKIGKNKSLNLKSFIEILKIPNIIFINLQYNADINDIVRFSRAHGVQIISFDDIDLFNDIDSLFALMEVCDFVITISNINAHVAGSLGKKTLLLAPFSRGRHWYWHDGLKKSLWYPSVEIFSQSETGDWSMPIKQIKEKILEEISRD